MINLFLIVLMCVTVIIFLYFIFVVIPRKCVQGSAKCHDDKYIIVRPKYFWFLLFAIPILLAFIHIALRLCMAYYFADIVFLGLLIFISLKYIAFKTYSPSEKILIDIYIATHEYQIKNKGAPPNSFTDLYELPIRNRGGNVFKKEILYLHSPHEISYVFTPQFILLSNEIPSDQIILAFEKRYNDGQMQCVLFYNGKIKYIKHKTLNNMLKKLEEKLR